MTVDGGGTVLLDPQFTAPICCDSSTALDLLQTAQTESDMAAAGRARDAPMILVVDDDHDICDMIAEALELDGHRVLTASNGQMALEQARRDRPDLIVLDLMMPVMNGWEFLEAQRGDPDLASVPVIVDTACPQTRVDGAAVILQKPFDVDTLLATVARLYEGGREHHLGGPDQLSA